MPVPIASDEQRFPRLKIIKIYLKTPMSQEKLSESAITCIKKEEMRNLEYKNVFSDFSKGKTSEINLIFIYF